MHKIQNFESKINYKFKDKSLLQEALTHPSVEPSRFELLEFIGDRVLSLCIANILWKTGPISEKDYARKFMPMTNKNALLAASYYLNLEKYVSWKGEKSHINTIMQDACEAVIGALFLDGGFEFTVGFVDEIWKKIHLESFSIADPLSILQNWANKRNIKIEYVILSENGPPHRREYVVELRVQSYKTIFGKAGALKEAKKKAAAIFLSEFCKTKDNGEFHI